MEIWKQIPGYDGYEVSNMGRVKSITRPILGSFDTTWIIKERVMKATISDRGYYKLALRFNNKSKTERVHRLVMLAFRGPSDLVVNHRDGNKLNNCLDNLEYCTQKQNVRHAWSSGLCNIKGK